MSAAEDSRMIDAIQNCNHLRLMLEVVSETRDESVGARAAWVSAVFRKLNLVDVVSLQDFVRSVMVVNERLVRGRHRQIPVSMLQQMFDESCDMLFGPIGWVEGTDGRWVEAGVEADVVGSGGMPEVD